VGATFALTQLASTVCERPAVAMCVCVVERDLPQQIIIYFNAEMEIIIYLKIIVTFVYVLQQASAWRHLQEDAEMEIQVW
jgi:hypothetical protein